MKNDVVDARPRLSVISARALGESPDPVGVAAVARELISSTGYAYLKDVPETFPHLDLLRQFGEFMPQYDGSLVWDLKPEPDMDDVYHSRNTQALVPHTEAYEFEVPPPRYLALWGIQPAQGPGGETTLADGREFLRTFSSADHHRMRTDVVEWHSTEGLARKNIHLSSQHHILTPSGDQTIFRFSYNNMSAGDDAFLLDFLDRGLRFFEATKHQISIERNGLLIWDNWRMLHSRNAFSDPGRHLKRVLVA